MKKHLENIAGIAGTIALILSVGCLEAIVETLVTFFERVI